MWWNATFRGFNSKLVRLKQAARKRALKLKGKMFQFQTGSIKAASRSPAPEHDRRSFNSKLVRLKRPRGVDPLHDEVMRFNSKLVRLKRMNLVNAAMNVVFGFNSKLVRLKLGEEKEFVIDLVSFNSKLVRLKRVWDVGSLAIAKDLSFNSKLVRLKHRGGRWKPVRDVEVSIPNWFD